MIPFLDLHKINTRFLSQFHEALQQSVDTSQYILGKHVKTFENEFAAYCGTKYCLGTANGLDALTLILKGYIKIGKLKKGDQIIVPANTFIATILSVLHAELQPVFIEPDPKTYNICPKAVETYLKSSDAKAIVMVHLYGQLAAVEALQELSKEYNLLLIEDAAQAHGAETTIANTHLRAGNLSNAAAFSFYPSKNLGALGDGGGVTTNDLELYNAISMLRNYGSSAKYKNDIIGVNSRLDDIQAAFLSVKLKTLDADNERRRHAAKRYLEAINNPKLKLPFHNGSNNHVFYAFVVEVEDREHFSKYLNKNKVGWLIHYPIPPHQQKALQQFLNLKLPITEHIHQHIISIPISPLMTDAAINTVINVLNQY